MNIARSDDLRFIFSQITAINTLRDRLAHHGDRTFIMVSSGDEHKAYHELSNTKRAARSTAEFTYRVSSEMLEAMIADLNRCSESLQHHAESDDQTFQRHQNSGDAATWLYKPPQPVGTKDESAGHPQKQKRQPKSSRQK